MTADNYEDLVMTLRRRPELRSTPGKMDLDDTVIADAIDALVKERNEWARKWHAVRAELAELKYPGMKGVIRINAALAAGKGEGGENMIVEYVCYPAAGANSSANGVYLAAECAGDAALLLKLIDNMRAANKKISVFGYPNLAVGLPAIPESETNETVQAGAEDSRVVSLGIDWRARYEYARDYLSHSWVASKSPTAEQYDEAVIDGIEAQLRIWNPRKDGK